jgi:excisionase family DNA binding protein
MEAPDIYTERLLKATEVAEILNISRAMSYRIIQRGEIRSVNIGSARRVRPTDLADYIRKNLTPSNQEEV